MLAKRVSDDIEETRKELRWDEEFILLKTKDGISFISPFNLSYITSFTFCCVILLFFTASYKALALVNSVLGL